MNKQVNVSELDPSDKGVTYNKSVVVTFGEGRDRVQVQFDNDGELRVASADGRLVVRPCASNAIHVTAEPF